MYCSSALSASAVTQQVIHTLIYTIFALIMMICSLLLSKAIPGIDELCDVSSLLTLLPSVPYCHM